MQERLQLPTQRPGAVPVPEEGGLRDCRRKALTGCNGLLWGGPRIIAEGSPWEMQQGPVAALPPSCSLTRMKED